jgi:uncharacterized membrane protein YbhN (UPF0104 family)
MRAPSPAPRRLPVRRILVPFSFAALGAAVVVVVLSADLDLVGTTLRTAAGDPAGVGLAIGAFGLAFLLRSWSWRRLVPSIGLGHALAAVHVSLGANHVLPLRLGEPLRVVSAVRRAGIDTGVATASTLVTRLADLATVVGLAAVLAPAAVIGSLGGLAWVLAVALAVGLAVAWIWVRRLAGRRPDVLSPGPVVILAAGGAWLLEAVLVWQSARWAGLELRPSEAVVVTAVAVSVQVLAVLPGGVGTYEAAAVAAYVGFGHDARAALAAAVTAHALKSAYSVVTGVVAVGVPAPGLLGRWRLAADRPLVPPVPAGPGPVVLFMPALDEEAAVGECVARVPATVHGRPVVVAVIDDGSRDGTAAAARAAGAVVVSFAENQGLGAAVRFGLRWGVDQGASAVAFCDADGEYPPEELAALVQPVLLGAADYVVGSRFGGEIEHMRPHRRLGNLLLTRFVRLAARTPVTDGQSGYRALSARAAADAEIVHDYNYAQVLTLDLLGKGYRYAEVPISYRFRTTGRSFVRLGPYLRRVIPAVHAELNRPAQSSTTCPENAASEAVQARLSHVPSS